MSRGSKSFLKKKNDELYAITLPFKKLNWKHQTPYQRICINYNLLSKQQFKC